VLRAVVGEVDAARKLDKQVQLCVYEAFSYYCIRPSATSVCGLKLLVYEVFRY
jgi:hypothetical protein